MADDDEEVFQPSSHDMEMFELARSQNPKQYSSHSSRRSGTKCATSDCCLLSVKDSIFCHFCDNERQHTIAVRSEASGSPREQARRSSAQDDARRGITKAAL